MASLADKIKSIGRLPSKIKATSKAAVNWFKNKVKEVQAKSITTPSKFLKSRDYDIVQSPKIGRMYSYTYDPKHKKTLPYYDTFPLMICIDIYKDGWLGLNLHYLPPKARAALLSALMTTINDKKLGKDAKLKVSYDIVKSASKYAAFKPCVKRYLAGHVKSPLIKIDPDDWLLVVFLPLQKFEKSSQTAVWADSLKQI